MQEEENIIKLFIEKTGRILNSRDRENLKNIQLSFTNEKIIELMKFWTETKKKELTSFAIIPYLKEEYEIYLEQISLMANMLEKASHKENKIIKVKLSDNNKKKIKKISLEDLENE